MSEALFGSELDAMVTAYLQELFDALRGLPASQRDHLISEIREHIVEMRAERPVRDRSDMEALLNRVGLPEDIAAVALDGQEEPEVAEPLVNSAITPPPARRYFEGRVSRRMLVASIGSAAVVVLGLVFAFAIGTTHRGIEAFSIIQRSSSAEPVLVKPRLPALIYQAVPNVIGETPSQAGATLSAVRLTFIEKTVSSSTAIGQVVSQSPSAGSLVQPGSQVTIMVSSGPAPT